jgi:hypothetical protein
MFRTMSFASLKRIGLLLALALASTTPAAAQQAAAPARTGQQVYETICITCHGPGGSGGVNLELEKVIELPDFSDCSFANREPDSDWLAVAHGGGPARGFSPLMAPWGGAFSIEELGLAVGHLRTFCKDDSWPRGELNLPLALVTGKAFPEDEAVVKVTSQDGNVVTRFVYERRFGALNQWEVALPINSVDNAGGRSTGLGDIALGYKRVLAHSLSRGNIASASAEVKLPSGSEDKGLGGGTAVFEPFLTFGQLLPRDSFVQVQTGFEIPFESAYDNEAFWRVAIGKSFEQGQFGRSWSPMFELLGAKPLVSGADVEWDVVPQMQVSLNKRQHIRLNAGARIPVNNRDHRSTSVIVYLLWDWFDGGFTDGW